MNDIVNEEQKTKKKDRFAIFILLLILFLTVSIGYAIVSTNLTINGSTVLKRSEWNVHLENPRVTSGSSFVQSGPTITSNGTIVSFGIALDRVNDLFELSADVYNEGTMDAKLSSFVKSGLTTEQEEYVEYDVTYADGTALSAGDVISAGERVTVKAKVKYVKLFPINEDDLTDTHVDVSLVFKLDYVQN